MVAHGLHTMSPNVDVYVTVRVSNQGFSQIPKTFRESVKFLFHSRIRSLNVYGYDLTPKNRWVIFDLFTGDLSEGLLNDNYLCFMLS